jgi:hypothetical protein
MANPVVTSTFTLLETALALPLAYPWGTITAVFAAFDPDCEGLLTVGEVQRAFRLIGVELEEEAWEGFLEALDIRGKPGSGVFKAQQLDSLLKKWQQRRSKVRGREGMRGSAESHGYMSCGILC